MHTGPLPKVMPVSLEILNLGGSYVNTNKFTGGIPPEWISMTNLKELRMERCGLDGECLVLDQCLHRAERSRKKGARETNLTRGMFPTRSCRRHPGVDRRAEQPADPRPPRESPLGYVGFILCMFSAAQPL